MRLEVLVDNQEPIIYPLASSKVTLGSGEACDIIVDSEGVSRKHLELIKEDGNCFVIDQGSTNGSFINEERLVPGRKVEFTAFFPIRLGENVLVSLLIEDELIEPVKQSTNTAIKPPDIDELTSDQSLKELNKAKIENLQTRSFSRRPTAPIIKEVKESQFGLLPILASVILIGAFGYKFFLETDEVAPAPISQVGKIITKPVTPLDTPNKQNLVAESDLPAAEYFNKIINDMKCVTDTEIYLCNFFSGGRDLRFGVSQVKLTAYILIDGTPYFDQARLIAKPAIDNSPVSIEKYENLVLDTAVYLYLLNNLKIMDLKVVENVDQLGIGLFKLTPEGHKVARIIAIKPKVYNELASVVVRENLNYINTNGASALSMTKDFYTVY